jgi:DNA-binding transcriptional ArsR family regulator
MPKPKQPASSKAAQFLNDVEVVFHALAHPARRQILLVLHYRGGEMTAGDIAGRFGCSWPTTTRHLGILRTAGLIEVRAEGRQRMYKLQRKRLDSVTSGWLKNFREE